MADKKNGQLRAAIVKVIEIHKHTGEEIDKFWEVESLISTLGGEVVLKTVQHRKNPHGATYIGSGKVLNLKQAVLDKKINLVVLNDIISPAKIYRLEENLWQANPALFVWDRMDLILRIFDHRASSAEAKLQIELARLKHLGPRIYGLGESLSQQAGGIGTRGIGEKKLEIKKRYIKDRIAKIEARLEKIIKNRQSQIKERRIKGYKTVALVGYTNAGKTSLFNLLTGKSKKVEDNVFTTLDSVLGKLNHLSKVPVLISDTIGFIRHLPPVLIDAFKSTLMESLFSEKVIHVIDASDEEMGEKIAVVEKILSQLGIEKKRQICVFNKIDLIDERKKEEVLNQSSNKNPFLVSCLTGQGIDNLIGKISLF